MEEERNSDALKICNFRKVKEHGDEKIWRFRVRKYGIQFNADGLKLNHDMKGSKGYLKISCGVWRNKDKKRIDAWDARAWKRH